MAIKEFGDLGRLVETVEYFEPDPVDRTDFDLDNDEHGLNLFSLKESLKAREASKREMQNNRPKFYALIEQKMSLESLEEIKRHRHYDRFSVLKDHLQLWQAIVETHSVVTASKVASITKMTARHNYTSLRQGHMNQLSHIKRSSPQPGRHMKHERMRTWKTKMSPWTS